MSTAFLVIGATGKQGGALVKALIKEPTFSPVKHTIYGLTRDIYSESSKRLAALSPAIKPVQGTFDNAPAIFEQLDPKPSGVFIVHAKPGGKEALECNALVDESLKHGAKHIVFSSVDRGGANSDNDPTDIPHFRTKHEVELHMKEQQARGGNFTYTILRPVFFLDNLKPGFFGKVIATYWRDTLEDVPLQVVDTRDIGEWAALAFMNPEDDKFRNKAISLAGDKVTFTEANKIWRDKTGEDMPTTYSIVPKGIFLLVREVATMFRWFRDVGYKAEIDDLKTTKPMVGFEEWVAREIAGK